MMGMPFTVHGMMGFDNVSGKYRSIWTDSMSTGIMVSEGSCEDDVHCSFSGSYNDPITKGPKTMRMTSHWTSPTTQVFAMYGAGRDGRERKMMELTYSRQ